jgi:uncharacterized protein (TIGR00661 family)
LPTVVYALCGTGRGHTSRATAVAETLRARGHRVLFAAGTPAAEHLAGPVYAIPALRQIVRGNGVRLAATARANWPHARHSLDTIAAAADWLRDVQADVVVADHEPFVGRAARRLGVPVVALSRQLLLAHARLDVPWRDALSAWGTARGITLVAPPGAAATVVPTFFFPPLRRGSGARLVPPVLRDDVLAQAVTGGARVLVYVNEGDGMEAFLDALGRVDAPFDAFGLPSGVAAPANVRLHVPDRAAFLACLGACRAVVATAGFTLLSEALHLGKPVLALPNRGFFEQAANARALVAAGRGEAVLGRDLRPADVMGFLSRAEAYARPPETRARGRRGCEAAADAVEAVLAGASQAAPGRGASGAQRNTGHTRRLSWAALRDNATP